MSETDPYTLLGIPRDADEETVRRAFRAIARRCHPDVAGADPVAAATFQAAREASELLLDPVRRAALDAPAGGGAARPRTRADREAFMRAMMRRQATGTAGRPADDPFESMFADVPRAQASTSWSAPPPEPQRTSVRFRQAAREPATEPSASVPWARRVDVSVTEALLGAWLTLDTPAGPTRVVLPPCTSSGAALRAEGRGEVGADGRRGDWVVEVRIVTPETLDPEARGLVEALASRIASPRR